MRLHLLRQFALGLPHATVIKQWGENLVPDSPPRHFGGHENRVESPSHGTSVSPLASSAERSLFVRFIVSTAASRPPVLPRPLSLGVIFLTLYIDLIGFSIIFPLG